MDRHLHHYAGGVCRDCGEPQRYRPPVGPTAAERHARIVQDRMEMLGGIVVPLMASVMRRVA